MMTFQIKASIPHLGTNQIKCRWEIKNVRIGLINVLVFNFQILSLKNMKMENLFGNSLAFKWKKILLFGIKLGNETSLGVKIWTKVKNRSACYKEFIAFWLTKLELG